MRAVVEITAADVAPAGTAVLRGQGLPERIEPDPRVLTLLGEALVLYAELVAPRGLFAEVTASEFADIYVGEGENAPETPLAGIYPRAERLALFAVTLGEAVSECICDLFASRDFALAAMLDAAASEGAELAAGVVERRYREQLAAAGQDAPHVVWLRYSPGYCGWHVSGQRALFAALRPEEIDLRLRESCLMEPLKSISGVIAGGPAAIHEFADDYPFCADCTDHGCQARIHDLQAPDHE